MFALLIVSAQAPGVQHSVLSSFRMVQTWVWNIAQSYTRRNTTVLITSTVFPNDSSIRRLLFSLMI